VVPFWRSPLIFLIIWLSCIPSSNANAQPAWLRLIGESGAATRVMAEIVESGAPAVRNALSHLGISAASDAQALARFHSLSPEQTGALLLHDTSLGHRYLSEFASNPYELKLHTGLYNTLRASDVQRNFIRGDTSKDTKQLFLLDSKTGDLIAPRSKPYDFDVGTGNVKLSRPFVFCSSTLCNIKLENFNAYAVGGAAVGGGYACLTDGCWRRVRELLQK